MFQLLCSNGSTNYYAGIQVQLVFFLYPTIFIKDLSYVLHFPVTYVLCTYMDATVKIVHTMNNIMSVHIDTSGLNATKEKMIYFCGR